MVSNATLLLRVTIKVCCHDKEVGSALFISKENVKYKLNVYKYYYNMITVSSSILFRNVC